MLHVTAVDYRYREYNNAEELLCAIIYKVFQQNNIFSPFECMLIDLSIVVLQFWNESANQLEVSPLGLVLLQLTSKSKSWYDDPVILQGTFMLESSQVLLISTFRSLDNLTVIKTQIVVPQKLDISNFRGIKHNDVTTNSYQFVGLINFEDNSTTADHYVAYL